MLSLVDVGLITGASYRRVADLLRGPYREKHPEEVLPMMGTVFDIGRATSHKATAVRLHLRGLLITEISKRMDHHPQRVQRYIDDFQRVAELLDKQVQLERITFITGLQTAVVKQYIELYERCKQEADQHPYLGEWLELEYATPKERENENAAQRSTLRNLADFNHSFIKIKLILSILSIYRPSSWSIGNHDSKFIFHT